MITFFNRKQRKAVLTGKSKVWCHVITLRPIRGKQDIQVPKRGKEVLPPAQRFATTNAKQVGIS
jgi:hypothetical protein